MPQPHEFRVCHESIFRSHVNGDPLPNGVYQSVDKSGENRVVIITQDPPRFHMFPVNKEEQLPEAVNTGLDLFKLLTQDPCNQKQIEKLRRELIGFSSISR